jgi:hypothetical protein
MATTTPNFGWPVPSSTDYVKDGAIAIEALGDAIDATVFALGSGGLTLITTATLSASSGQIFSGLVAGKTYRIVGNVFGSVGSATLNCRFRETSTDKTTSYYGANFFTSYSGASGNVNPASGATQMILNVYSTAITSSIAFSYDLNVQTTNGRMYGNSQSSQESRSYFGGFSNESMTGFNAINFFPSSGTLTGTISLYEYE